MAKSGLTFKRHQQIGQRLKDIQIEMMALHTDLSQSYPKLSRELLELERLERHLGRLRSFLEGRMFSEYPGLALFSVYHPRDEAPD